MFKFSPKGTLAGSLVFLAWSLFSWMVLPWHQFSDVKNELELSSVISTSIPENGVYVLPNMPQDDNYESLNRYAERKLKGPSGIFLVSASGTRSFNLTMVFFLFGILFISFLFSIFLNLVLNLDKLQRAILISLVSMTGGLACLWPYFVWWHFPFSWVLVQVLDLGIGWFLAGFFLAKFSKTNIDINFRLSPLKLLRKLKIQG
jgi:hypothetical protein